MTVDEMLRTAAAELRAEVGAEVDASAALQRTVDRRPPRRRLPLLAAAAVLVALVAVAVAVGTTRDDGEPVTSAGPTTTVDSRPTAPGPAPGEAVGLTITATPVAGLRDGDRVTVVVEGLEEDPMVTVELVMCQGDAMDLAPDPRSCEGPTATPPVEVGGGRGEGTIAVDQIINPNSGEAAVDCARIAAGCAVGVTANTSWREGEVPSPDAELGPRLVGLVGVSFAPRAELDPQLAVEPDTGLEHGSTVTLRGTGLQGSLREALLCAPSQGDEACTMIPLSDGPRAFEGPTVEGDGTFEVDVRVWRAFPASGLVDCAAVACTLTVVTEDGHPVPPVPLGFSDATPTPAIPTFTVRPTTGIRVGDPITLTVEGVAPGTEVPTSACLLEGGRCGAGTSLVTLTADEAGVATLTTPAIDIGQYGQTCVEPGVCGVVVDTGAPTGEITDPLLRLVSPVPVQYAPP